MNYLGRDPVVAGLLDRCAFPGPGTAVTAAVSGGADSTALLVLAVAAGCDVTAVHVDHGLRPGSAAEADTVAATAARFGARFRAERVDVADGPNLEARARAARYAVLPRDVMTGHTADDVAETVLVNLLRGAGLDGLSPFQRPGPVRRPILALRRAETEGLCRALDVDVVVDPSNEDPRHVRNRVRHEVLPLLDDVAGRDVAALLARQAGVIGDEASVLDELARSIDPTDARAAAGAPAPVARRALRAWLRPLLGDHPPDRDGVERVLAVARGEAVATEVAGGHRVARRQGRLRVERVADGRTGGDAVAGAGGGDDPRAAAGA